jgi:photosystem II stability/assembly factor-like uncharacterized protein
MTSWLASWSRGAYLLILLAVLPPATRAATDYAMIMPKAATSLLLDIAAAGERLVAVGERGHILYSGDGGESWTQAQVPTSVMLTRVFFLNERTGWAVGHDGNILLSTDGGVNWTLQRDGVTDQAQINEGRVARARGRLAELKERLPPVPEDGREALLEALEQAQLELETALEILDEPVYAPPLMDIWFADESRGWASGAYGVLLHTANGGRDWGDWSHKAGNPDELHFNGVAGDGEGNLYLASEWGYVFRSGNGGETWYPMETGYEGSFFGVVVDPATGSAFAYGLLGTVYRSTDGGESWDPLDTGIRASLFGAAGDGRGSLVFVGQNGTAVRTDDDGDRFTVLPQGSRRGFYGVAPLPGGGYAVTGQGGSALLKETASPKDEAR